MSAPVYTIREYCVERLKRRRPILAFPFSKPEDHLVWRGKLRAALWREFGNMPERVPLSPRILERKDCGHYIREKVIFKSERWMWVPAWVLIPKKSPLKSKNGKLPGLLAAHGHGPDGKDNVIHETAGSRKRAALIKRLNYAYGLEAVRRGYAVIAPDWRTFGERRDPDNWVRSAYRDGCDVANHAVQYFGVHLLGLDVWDGLRAIDYLISRPEVDGRRIGCLGLSFGGTMTTYLTAFDSRIRVACVSGYVSTLKNAMDHRNGNFCGSQAMPNLATYGDIPDVVLLAAPRPLCVEIGAHEDCFYSPDMKRAARYVARGYRVLGIQDRLVIDLFPGKHEFSGRKSWDWFEKWLA